MTRLSTSVLIATLAAPLGVAHAVVFPADTSYHPLHCHGHRMTDLAGDQPAGATADRDIVGDATSPAGLRAADDQYLYLRLRLNQAPNSLTQLHPYAWGMAFDLDGDLRNYELLIVAEGISSAAGTVSIYTNKTITTLNSPADPADLPAAATIAFNAAGRATPATSSFSGDTDAFIDLAIPWTTLAPLGLARDTPVHVWAGTSSVANALDGDLACSDGPGAAVLDAADPSGTTGDPTMDPSGDGGDDGTGSGSGIDPNSLRLEGGSGCATSGAPSLAAGLLVALAMISRRRRR